MQLATCRGHLFVPTSRNGFTKTQSLYRPYQQRVCLILAISLFPIYDVPLVGILTLYRILELREGGFIDHWDLWFRPMPGQCIENFKRGGFKSPRSRKYPSLWFKNLSGAFLLFLVGTSLSVLAFLCEHIISMTGRLRLCRRN